MSSLTFLTIDQWCVQCQLLHVKDRRESLQEPRGIDVLCRSKAEEEDALDEVEDQDSAAAANKTTGYSSGERQLQSLSEIVRQTNAKVYLLDEWDANLDASNRAKAQTLIDELAARSLVVEISHRG